MKLNILKTPDGFLSEREGVTSGSYETSKNLLTVFSNGDADIHCTDQIVSACLRSDTERGFKINAVFRNKTNKYMTGQHRIDFTTKGIRLLSDYYITCYEYEEIESIIFYEEGVTFKGVQAPDKMDFPYKAEEQI